MTHIDFLFRVGGDLSCETKQIYQNYASFNKNQFLRHKKQIEFRHFARKRGW